MRRRRPLARYYASREQHNEDHYNSSSSSDSSRSPPGALKFYDEGSILDAPEYLSNSEIDERGGAEERRRRCHAATPDVYYVSKDHARQCEEGMERRSWSRGWRSGNRRSSSNRVSGVRHEASRKHAPSSSASLQRSQHPISHTKTKLSYSTTTMIRDNHVSEAPHDRAGGLASGSMNVQVGAISIDKASTLRPLEALVADSPPRSAQGTQPVHAPHYSRSHANVRDHEQQWNCIPDVSATAVPSESTKSSLERKFMTPPRASEYTTDGIVTSEIASTDKTRSGQQGDVTVAAAVSPCARLVSENGDPLALRAFVAYLKTKASRLEQENADLWWAAQYNSSVGSTAVGVWGKKKTRVAEREGTREDGCSVAGPKTVRSDRSDISSLSTTTATRTQRGREEEEGHSSPQARCRSQTVESIYRSEFYPSLARGDSTVNTTAVTTTATTTTTTTATGTTALSSNQTKNGDTFDSSHITLWHSQDTGTTARFPQPALAGSVEDEEPPKKGKKVANFEDMYGFNRTPSPSKRGRTLEAERQERSLPPPTPPPLSPLASIVAPEEMKRKEEEGKQQQQRQQHQHDQPHPTLDSAVFNRSVESVSATSGENAWGRTRRRQLPSYIYTSVHDDDFLHSASIVSTRQRAQCSKQVQTAVSESHPPLGTHYLVDVPAEDEDALDSSGYNVEEDDDVNTIVEHTDRTSVIELHTSPFYSRAVVRRLQAYCDALESSRRYLKERIIVTGSTLGTGSDSRYLAARRASTGSASAATRMSSMNASRGTFVSSTAASRWAGKGDIVIAPRRRFFRSEYCDPEVDATLHDVEESPAVDTMIVLADDGEGTVSKKVIDTVVVVSSSAPPSEAPQRIVAFHTTPRRRSKSSSPRHIDTGLSGTPLSLTWSRRPSLDSSVAAFSSLLPKSLQQQESVSSSRSPNRRSLSSSLPSLVFSASRAHPTRSSPRPPSGHLSSNKSTPIRHLPPPHPPSPSLVERASGTAPDHRLGSTVPFVQLRSFSSDESPSPSLSPPPRQPTNVKEALSSLKFSVGRCVTPNNTPVAADTPAIDTAGPQQQQQQQHQQQQEEETSRRLTKLPPPPPLSSTNTTGTAQDSRSSSDVSDRSSTATFDHKRESTLAPQALIITTVPAQAPISLGHGAVREIDSAAVAPRAPPYSPTPPSPSLSTRAYSTLSYVPYAPHSLQGGSYHEGERSSFEKSAVDTTAYVDLGTVSSSGGGGVVGVSGVLSSATAVHTTRLGDSDARSSSVITPMHLSTVLSDDATVGENDGVEKHLPPSLSNRVNKDDYTMPITPRFRVAPRRPNCSAHSSRCSSVHSDKRGSPCSSIPRHPGSSASSVRSEGKGRGTSSRFSVGTSSISGHGGGRRSFSVSPRFLNSPRRRGDAERHSSGCRSTPEQSITVPAGASSFLLPRSPRLSSTHSTPLLQQQLGGSRGEAVLGNAHGVGPAAAAVAGSRSSLLMQKPLLPVRENGQGDGERDGNSSSSSYHTIFSDTV